MGEDRSQTSRQRVTVAQAAEILGVTVEAIRGRIKRRTLEHERHSGTVYVLLPPDMSRDAERHTTDTPGGMPPSDSDVLTSELRDRLRYVEDQLEAERQAHAEARRLLMAALERIPPQLEAPSEARESPQTVEEETEGAEPRTATVESQEGEQRPWWRRWFGG